MRRLLVILVVLLVIISGSLVFAQTYRMLQPGQVLADTINPVSNPVDLWVIELPPSAVTIFLWGADLETYRVGFLMYTEKYQLLGHDSRLDEFKPHFGTVAGGKYYLVVYALYTENKTVSYLIGSANATIPYSLSSGGTQTFNFTVNGGKRTWLFLVDRSDNFNPDIFVYYQGRRIGSSEEAEDLDFIFWDIPTTTAFEIRIVATSGSGIYWIMSVSY